MTEPDDDRRIREALASRTATTPHPDEARWEALACGELSPADRLAVMDHVAACPACAQIYRGLEILRAEASALDAGVPRTSAAPARPRATWAWAGLAAAAVLAIALLPRLRPDAPPPTEGPDTLRSAGKSTAPPIPIAPTGVGPAPKRLQWHAAEGATAYDIKVLGESGDLLWRKDGVAGTSADWPASIAAPPGHYYWQVSARTAGPEPLASELVSFEIAP